MKWKIYQTSWLGIDFRSVGLNLSLKKLADSAFYSEFWSIWKSLNLDFPEGYTREKQETAKLISSYLEKNLSINIVISIGSGSLITENMLKKFSGIDVYHTDSGIAPKKPLSLNEVLKPESNALIIMNQLIYALEDEELIDSLKFLRSLGLGDESRVMISEQQFKWLGKNKNRVQGVLLFLHEQYRQIALGVAQLFGVSYLNDYQFWGYRRTPKYLIKKAQIGGWQLESESSDSTQTLFWFKQLGCFDIGSLGGATTHSIIGIGSQLDKI